MSTEKYEEDFKKKVAKEALQVGNNTAVGKKYNTSEGNVRSWIKKYYESPIEILAKNAIGTPLKGTVKDLKDAKKKIDYYVKIIGEKELEIQVLKDLLKKLNVRLPQSMK